MDEVYKPRKRVYVAYIDKNTGNSMSLAADLRKLIGVRRLLCCVSEEAMGATGQTVIVMRSSAG